MTIIELKSDIMHKHLSNFYIFTGEEIGIMNIYLNQISKTLNIPNPCLVTLLVYML